MNLEFNKNQDAMMLAVAQMKQRHSQISPYGGKRAVDKDRGDRKMSPRERIAYLVEKDSTFMEVGAFTGYEMYSDYGGYPLVDTISRRGDIDSANVGIQFFLSAATYKPYYRDSKVWNGTWYDYCKTHLIVSLNNRYFESNQYAGSNNIHVYKNSVQHTVLPSAISNQFENRHDTQTVFVSYCHSDRSYLDRMQVHLKPFGRKRQIDLWDDTRLRAGQKWRDEVEAALDRATIAIILISADFLASDFIIDNELPPLLEAAEQRGKTILPVIVKPCRFINDVNLSRFQAINDPKTPLSKLDYNSREEIYVAIANRIEELIG